MGVWDGELKESVRCEHNFVTPAQAGAQSFTFRAEAQSKAKAPEDSPLLFAGRGF
jgi:hypothetical protein